MPFVIARSSCDEAIQPAFRGSGLLRFARNDGKAGFRVDFVRDWKQAEARWRDLGHATPFQNGRWLEAWYGAFADTAGVEPLIAVISNAATGKDQVQALVYINGWVPDEGESVVQLAELNEGSLVADSLHPVAYKDADGTDVVDLYIDQEKFPATFAAEYAAAKPVFDSIKWSK